MAPNQTKSVSIVEIAEHLGISKTTVGYVLAGEAKKRRVADKTAQKVFNAAEKLNYVPHLWAKNLARQRTGVIGMVIGGYEYDWPADVMGGALPALEDQGYLPMTSIHLWDPKRNERELMMSMERRDEGIICQPLPQCTDAYREVFDHKIPLLFIADTLEDMPQVSYVAWDCAPAAKKAVQHLIEIGRRRIGFIGSELIVTRLVRDRYQAYKDALDEAGIEFDENIVRWSPLYDWVGWDSIHGGQQNIPQNGDFNVIKTLESLMTSRGGAPDALFFPHDSLAITAYRALIKMGIKVPEEIALMGMGDVPLSDDIAVGLSTIREPLERIGQAAAETIVELIKDPEQGPIHRLIEGNELKIRKTTIGTAMDEKS